MDLMVNGQTHSVNATPDTPLLYVLRNDLQLNAAKFGCGLGQCGACTVIADGKPVLSCVMPIALFEGRQITTVEGLGTENNPAPIQQAFIEEQAAQCGYCIAGMIMRAQALLAQDNNPIGQRHPYRAAIQSLPLRHTYAHSQSRTPRGRYDAESFSEGSNLMNAPLSPLSRRTVLKGGGALVVSFSLSPAFSQEQATPAAAAKPAAKLPGSLAKTPYLDSWIRIDAKGHITVLTGKAELGQGIKTALIQVAAEELDVPFGSIELITADTGRTANEGYTSGSHSMQDQRDRHPQRCRADARPADRGSRAQIQYSA